MTVIIKQLTYSTLKTAYLEVNAFIEKYSGDQIDSLETKLVDDLGISGEDNWYFLNDFINTYKLNADNFDYDKHFQSENELFGSEAAFWLSVKVITYLPLFLIKVITFGKIKADNIDFKIFKMHRYVEDLTIRNLIVWYIEKDYQSCNQISYKFEI